MVGHCAVEPEPTKPPVGEVQVHLLAQPPLGADAPQGARRPSDNLVGSDFRAKTKLGCSGTLTL